MAAVRPAAYNRFMRSDKDEQTETGEEEADSAGDEDTNQADANQDETPAGTRRGERSDNLRRRSEWFQKRTGGR
jgi:hypothetical protein